MTPRRMGAPNGDTGATMVPKITLTESPDDGAVTAIGRFLTEFNEVGSAPPNDFRALAVLLSEPENEETLGGLWGWTSFSFLQIDLLYILKAMRGAGLGSRLIHMAEEEAMRRGCSGAWLDTFSFQARGFYEKLGYAVFGSIEDYPPGHSRFFLKKTFFE